MQERLSTASAGIGVGVAAALGVGVAANLDMQAANAKLTAQLGVGPAEAAELSKVSAQVYGDAWGDSTETVNLAIKGVYQNIGDVSQAKGGLEAVTSKVLALAETFDQDLGVTTAAVGQLVRTGMANDVDEAMDIVAKGLSTAADKSGDFLETLNEYSTLWRRVGLDGKTATGLLSQGLKAGARDADQVADAIGIFGEMALSNSDAVKEAYKSIGVDSDHVAKLMGKGGASAKKALQITMDALRGAKNETVQLTAAQALFGDTANTMGESLFALDPASAAASAGMDKVAGAAEKAMKTMADNPAKQLEKFKRQVVQKLSEVAGKFISFGMENQGLMKPLAAILGVIAGLVMAVAVAQKIYATYTAIATVATKIHNAALFKTIAGYLRLMAVGLMAMARMAAAAVASAATTAAAWVGSALAAIGTWIAAVVRAGVTAVAQFALMAARAVAWAVTMAAQWFIAMGPIGWAIAAVVGLVALIIANWDKVKGWTRIAWDWVWNKVKQVAKFLVDIFLNFTLVGLIIKHWSTIKRKTAEIWNGIVAWVKGVPRMIYNAFLNFTPIGLMIKHWDTMKRWVVIKATDIVNWVRGLPGRISRAIGNLGSLLYNKGLDVVRGLWNGIKAMGSWLKSTLTGWARNLIPGPIARALGISSPSKLMARKIGRWIPAGVVKGIESGNPVLRRVMARLAAVPRPSHGPAAGGSTISPVGPLNGPSGGRTVLEIRAGNSKVDEFLMELLRRAIRVRGGDVQLVLGR
ncbi:phage tail tape measure protein [Streptomyces sp. NPDC049887]|uniref:phage tail tape measure protein n=1 Tax=Streptomyces sp. NPDC049887 TaxID=3155654 RepID=UPI0034480AE3